MKLLNQILQYSKNTPEKIAFKTRDEQITYQSLWNQSSQLASFIQKMNLKRQTPIVVYGHFGIFMPVSFLACVKAGHPYIPVDISMPIERIRLIIEKSGAALVLNTTETLMDFGKVPTYQVTKLDLTQENLIGNEHQVKPDEVFYIIYTSGSTGNPKGVQITSNNLQSFIDWMLHDFPLDKEKVYLNQAPFSFDLSVMSFYPALESGGTIEALEKDVINKPKIMFEHLSQTSLQVWTSTPSFVQFCLANDEFNQQLLPNLEVFLFCGEVLPLVVARELKQRFPKARIFNTYGPTEATVAVTSIEITDHLLQQDKALPVGYPKSDMMVIVIDESGNALPNGEKGELILVGPSVSEKGYLGEEELTKKAFGQVDGLNAYRTGDVGFIQDGIVYCQGRIDYQIKLHGYRIELEEIEFHLNQCNYINASVVIPYAPNGEIEYLIASVVPASHNFEKEYQLTAAIRKELSQNLPSYMIPRKFAYYTTLPMTINGKVDRKRMMEEVYV